MSAQLRFDPDYVRAPHQTLVEGFPEEDGYSATSFCLEWGTLVHRGRLDGSARALVVGQNQPRMRRSVGASWSARLVSGPRVSETAGQHLLDTPVRGGPNARPSNPGAPVMPRLGRLTPGPRWLASTTGRSSHAVALDHSGDFNS